MLPRPRSARRECAVKSRREPAKSGGHATPVLEQGADRGDDRDRSGEENAGRDDDDRQPDGGEQPGEEQRHARPGRQALAGAPRVTGVGAKQVPQRLAAS
jgi:hypothetical protein